MTTSVVEVAGWAECRKSACTKVGHWQVCKCRRAEDSRFLVDLAGRRVATWPAADVSVGLTSFRAAVTDLDGDGTGELVVADLEAVSNGMAVQSWSVQIARESAPERPLKFFTADFDLSAVHLTPEGCSFLATEWAWEGDHLAFVARPWRLSGERLVASAAPMQKRRFSKAFERQRRKGGTVWEWLEGAGSTEVASDESAVPEGLAEATLERVERTGDRVRLHVRTGGNARPFALDDDVRLVDGASLRRFPVGYAPPLPTTARWKPGKDGTPAVAFVPAPSAPQSK